MTDPQRYPVETARKKIADILDGTQFRGEHAEITRRDKPAGYLVPPEWYLSITAEVEALRRKVEKLGTTDGPQPAVVAPRARVSAMAPEPSPEAEQTEPAAEADAPLPLPEMTEGRFRRVIALAQSRATPDQRERLNRTAKVSEQLGRNAHNEVLTAAFEMGLLKRDEVYATDEPERPAGGQEKTG